VGHRAACVGHIDFTDGIDPSWTDERFIRRMLAAKWPGIAFELPPGHGDP
jgi:hypothetical protein